MAERRGVFLRYRGNGLPPEPKTHQQQFVHKMELNYSHLQPVEKEDIHPTGQLTELLRGISTKLEKRNSEL